MSRDLSILRGLAKIEVRFFRDEQLDSWFLFWVVRGLSG